MDKYSLLKSLGLSKINDTEVFHETTKKVKGLLTTGMDNSTIVEYLLTQELVNQFLNEGDDGSADATSLVANIRTSEMVSSSIAENWMEAWQGTSPVVYDTEHPFGGEMDTDEAEYIVQGMLSDLRIDDVPKSHSATMGSTANLITQLSKTGGPTALAKWCSSNLTNIGRAMVGDKDWKYTQEIDSPLTSSRRIKNRVFLKKQGDKWYALGQADLATLAPSDDLLFVTSFKYFKEKYRAPGVIEEKLGPQHRGAKQYPKSMWFKGVTPVEINLGHPVKLKKEDLDEDGRDAKWDYCKHWIFGTTGKPSPDTTASADDLTKSRGIVTDVAGYIINSDELLVKALCAAFLTVGEKETSLGVQPNDSLPSDGLKGFALGRTVEQLTVDRPAAEKAAKEDHSDKSNDPEAKLAAETGDVESMYAERMESFKAWLNAVSPLQEGQEEPEATFETASIPRVWLIPGNADHDIRIYFGPNESPPSAALLDEGKRKDDVGNWDEAEMTKVWSYHVNMGTTTPDADEIASWAGTYVGLKYIKADVKKTKYRAESTLSSGAFNLAGTGQKDAAKTRGPMYQWLVDLRKWMTRAEAIMSIEQQVGFDTCPFSLSSLGSENVTALTNLLSWEAIQKGAESASTSMPIITTIGSLLTTLGYSIKPLSTGGQGTRSLAQKASSGDTSVSANVMYIAAILMTWSRCYRESLNAWVKQLANEAGGDYSAAQDQGTDRAQVKQAFLNAGFNPKINTNKVVLNAMEIIISEHPHALQEIKKKEQFMAEKRPKEKGMPVTGRISPGYANQNRIANQEADAASSKQWEKSEQSALKTIRHHLLDMDDDASWNALGINSWDDLDKERTMDGVKYNIATQLDKYLGKSDAIPQDLTDFYTANKRSAQVKWKDIIDKDAEGARPAFSKYRRGGGPLSKQELEVTWSKIHNLLWGLIERMGYPMKNKNGEKVSLPDGERTGAAWAVSTGYRAQLMQSLKSAIKLDYDKNKVDGDPAYAESGTKKAVDHFLKESLLLETQEGSLQKASKMLSLIPDINSSSFIDEFRSMVGKVKDGKAVIKKYPGGAFLVDPIGSGRAGVAFIPTGAQPELIKLTNLGQRGPSYEVAAVSGGNSVVLSLIDQTEALLLAKTKLWSGTNPAAQQQAAQEQT